MENAPKRVLRLIATVLVYSLALVCNVLLVKLGLESVLASGGGFGLVT